MEFQRIVVWQSSDLHNCQRKRQTHSKPVDGRGNVGGREVGMNGVGGMECGKLVRSAHGFVRLRLTTARRLINIPSKKHRKRRTGARWL